MSITVRRIEEEAMSVSEAFRGVVDESVESIELAPGANGFHLGEG